MREQRRDKPGRVAMLPRRGGVLRPVPGVLEVTVQRRSTTHAEVPFRGALVAGRALAHGFAASLSGLSVHRSGALEPARPQRQPTIFHRRGCRPFTPEIAGSHPVGGTAEYPANAPYFARCCLRGGHRRRPDLPPKTSGRSCAFSRRNSRSVRPASASSCSSRARTLARRVRSGSALEVSRHPEPAQQSCCFWAVTGRVPEQLDGFESNVQPLRLAAWSAGGRTK